MLGGRRLSDYQQKKKGWFDTWTCPFFFIDYRFGISLSFQRFYLFFYRDFFFFSVFIFLLYSVQKREDSPFTEYITDFLSFALLVQTNRSTDLKKKKKKEREDEMKARAVE